MDEASAPLFTPRVYFILFVPAVMFATWFGGLASGILASALSVIAAALLLAPNEIGDQLVWVIVAGVVTFVTSVVTAARHRVERQLAGLASAERARRHEAESLSQLKTDLLAQVAHELRQPLSAMSVGTRLLDVTQIVERGRHPRQPFRGRPPSVSMSIIYIGRLET